MLEELLKGGFSKVGALKVLAQNEARRETVPGRLGGARRTLCAFEDLHRRAFRPFVFVLFLASITFTSLTPCFAQPALVSTLIGGAAHQYPFSAGVPGPNAAIYSVAGIALDVAGNLFVADRVGNRVIRIDHQTGLASAYAGTGVPGVSGDGGPANIAELSSPSTLAVDAAGGLYIFENQRIRKVDAATGLISTYVVTGYLSAAPGSGYNALALDPSGNLIFTYLKYVTPGSNQPSSFIYRVDAATKAITTIAGGGSTTPANGVGALSANFSWLGGVRFDPAGNLYFGDRINNCIWKIAAGSSTLALVAGSGKCADSGDGGPGTSAAICFPTSLVVDSSGGLLFSSAKDENSAVNLIRRVDLTTGIITAVAPATGSAPSPFGSVVDLAVGVSGQILASDSPAPLGLQINPPPPGTAPNQVLQFVPSTGAVSPVAGNGQSLSYSPDTLTNWLDLPLTISDLAVNPDGNIFVFAEGRIYEANFQTGILQRIAGTGAPGATGDGGPALQASFGGNTHGYSLAMYINSAGDIYLADGVNGGIRRIDSQTGVITTAVPNAANVGFHDVGVCGPAVDPAGDVFYADFNHLGQILRADGITGNITVYAGNASVINDSDGTLAADATLQGPCPWLVDPTGALYFDENETSGTPLRRIDPQSGLLSTASVLQGLYLSGLTRDSSGNFYFTQTYDPLDGSGNVIGSIPVSGGGTKIIARLPAGDAGDGSVLSSAQFQIAGPIGLDPQGNLLLVSNGRVRKIGFVTGNQPVFGPASILNAASLTNGVAPNTWATLFGQQLASKLTAANATPLPTTLDNTSVQIVDSSGKTYQAQLEFVGPNQINFLMPAGVAIGQAQLTVVDQSAASAPQPLTILSQAPGLFTANSSGTGVAAGFALYVYPDGTQQSVPLYKLDFATEMYVPNPTPIPTSGDVVYLTLFGTGWTGITTASASLSIGGASVPLVYVGPQGSFAGLDQINVGPLPTSLKQNPGVVNLEFSVGTSQVNVVQIGVY